MASQVARWSTPFQIATPSGSIGFPVIAPVGGPDAGEFVVIWTEFGDPLGLGDGSGYGIYGQLYNEDGSKQGSAFLVNSTTSSDQISPVVIDRSSEEGFAVAFTDLSGANGTGTDVRMRLFDGDGNAEGADFV